MDWLMTFTDWRIIAMAATIMLLWLRGFSRSSYSWLWQKLNWNWKLVIPAILGVSIILIRELLFYPYSWVIHSWPTLSPVAHMLLYGDSIHFRSILFFSALIILLWRKYGFLLPALAVGWFCLGIVELTFIFQHYICIPGKFMGLDWYIPFIGILFYFVVIHKCFRFSRKFLAFFAAAIFVQYFMIIFYPYWLCVYDNKEGMGFTINFSVLPIPPIQTWIFWFLNHFMKVLFTVAFYFVEKTKNDISPSKHLDPLIDIGRHDTSRTFLTDEFGLNIGSGKTFFPNKLNLDIKHYPGVDIVASVLHLPFTNNSFDEVLYGDVMEHIEENHELKSLQEISRTLKPHGHLVFSIPSTSFLSRFVDFAWRIRNHRHYTPKEVHDLLSQSNFQAYCSLTSGSIPFLLATFYSFFKKCSKKEAYIHCSHPYLGGNYFIIARKQV